MERSCRISDQGDKVNSLQDEIILEGIKSYRTKCEQTNEPKCMCE